MKPLKHSMIAAIFAIALTIIFAHPVQAQMTNLCNGCSTTINAHGVCKNVYNGAGPSIMIPWNNSTEWYLFYAQPHAGVSVSECATPLGLNFAGFTPYSCYGEGCWYDIYFDAYGGSGGYRIYTENSGGAIIHSPLFGTFALNSWGYGNALSMSGNRVTASLYIHVTGGTAEVWIADGAGQVAVAYGGFSGY